MTTKPTTQQRRNTPKPFSEQEKQTLVADAIRGLSPHSAEELRALQKLPPDVWRWEIARRAAAAVARRNNGED